MKKQSKKHGLIGQARRTFGFLVGGCLLTVLVSIGLAALVWNVGGQLWLIGIAFVLPGILFMGYVFRQILRLANQLNPTDLSPEGRAVHQAKFLSEITEPDDNEEDENEEDEIEEEEAFPTVPEVSTQPGEQLRHALPLAGTPPLVKLLGSLLIALFWNSIVSVFVYQAIMGQGGWFLRIFIIPFVIVGLVLLAVLLFSAYEFLLNLMVGSLRVEISRHPLHPSDFCDVVFRQGGSFTLSEVIVLLQRVESVTYTQGTSTSTTEKVVANYDAVAENGHYRVQVPADAMHSFEANRNRIKWQILVAGTVIGLFRYGQEFAVQIQPRKVQP